MWFLLFLFMLWSAVPRVFALSAVLAEIRATEPCTRPGAVGWRGARARLGGSGGNVGGSRALLHRRRST